MNQKEVYKGGLILKVITAGILLQKPLSFMAKP